MTDPIEAALAEMEKDNLCYEAGNCGFQEQRDRLVAALRVAVRYLRDYPEEYVEPTDPSAPYDVTHNPAHTAILAALRGE
jgi:hypothetical protein